MPPLHIKDINYELNTPLLYVKSLSPSNNSNIEHSFYP